MQDTVFDTIFPLVNKSRQDISNTLMNVKEQHIRRRMKWLISVYTCTQVQFVQKFLATEPSLQSFYALHAVALHSKDPEHMNRWYILEKVALQKKLLTHDAQLRKIATHYNTSISRANNNSYFKFPHNDGNVYTDDFSKDMVKHAFPGWSKIQYKEEIPANAFAEFLEHSQTFKDIRAREEEEAQQARTKRARIEEDDAKSRQSEFFQGPFIFRLLGK